MSRTARVRLYAEAPLPTTHGTFRLLVFREARSDVEHLAMVMGDASGDGVLARVHSECLTSEVLGSLKCDCKAQLDRALDLVAHRGRGVVLYLRQEGRGIGLGNKVRAYALQAQGLDTYEANRELGFADDLRRYDVAAEMLKALGVVSVDLITNNPEKLRGLAEAGVAIHRRVGLPSPANPHNRGYLETKRALTGHLIQIEDAAPAAKAG